MIKYKEGNLVQQWIFDNSVIDIRKRLEGDISQHCEFPETFKKDATNGELTKKWNDYKSMIARWCSVNNFYMGEENCVLYWGKLGLEIVLNS